MKQSCKLGAVKELDAEKELETKVRQSEHSTPINTKVKSVSLWTIHAQGK